MWKNIQKCFWFERFVKQRFIDLLYIFVVTFMENNRYLMVPYKVARDKGISEMKSKQQSPCSICMHRPVMSWSNSCSTCIHKPVRCMHQLVRSQANACTYCMGSEVSSLSRIYLYSSYLGSHLDPYWEISMMSKDLSIMNIENCLKMLWIVLTCMDRNTYLMVSI